MSDRRREHYSTLAGEYVLGLLAGQARARFERLMAEDPELRQLVRDWEAGLAFLDEDVEPVQPPVRVWRKVEERAQLTVGRSEGFWNNVLPWRIFALSATALSVFLTVLLLRPLFIEPSPVTPIENYISVIRNQENEALWVIQTDVNNQILRVSSLQSPSMAGPDKAFQLWLLPREGQELPPRSMGLLPIDGRQELALPLADELVAQANIAVSLEPSGGSPTGLPTGPVLFVSDLIPL